MKFTSFTGNNSGNINQLKWNVSQEDDLSHYTLERSDDGAVFYKVADINAQNSPSPTSYSYNDNISNNSSATFYYRLKAVNNDGTYQYSEIVVIKLDKKSFVRIAGNPFHSHLTIQYTHPVQSRMQVRLYDMNGRVIKMDETAIQPGTGVYTLNDLYSLSKGTYVVEILLDKKRIVEKVLKN